MFWANAIKNKMRGSGGEAEPESDPNAEQYARILASVRGSGDAGAQRYEDMPRVQIKAPVGQSNATSNPYEQGLRQDPANMAGSGRLEPGYEQKIQRMVIEELARENPDFKVSPAPAQYPQQVKQPLRR